MPYSSNEKLPAQAEALPEEAKTVFRRVFNESSKNGKSEEVSFAYAWTAVKNGWKKDSEGNWQKLQKSDNSHLTNDSKYDTMQSLVKVSEIFKSDEEARIVYGWANKITKDGETVYDLQGDSISPQELLSSTTEFMKSADRHSLNMHQGNPVGQVVHSFPLTYDIAKSLGLETKDEGWLVGVHVSDDETWKLVKNGTLSSFSIGGSALRKEID